MEDRIMRQLQERYLEQAQRAGRFVAQESKFYIVKIRKGHVKSDNHNQSKHFKDWRDAFAAAWVNHPEHRSTLNCIFQSTRPKHISGEPDALPFENIDELKAVFETLRLPSSYFQIASGRAASAQSHTFRNLQDQPMKHEMIVHFVSIKGDWAMALSHHAANRTTSVFWSVESNIDSTALLADFSDFQMYSLHPMLILCIMVASMVRVGVQRRREIKHQISLLENNIRNVSGDNTSLPGQDHTQTQELERLFRLLQDCRIGQSSKKGRVEFWKSIAGAIEEGFAYIDTILAAAPDAHLKEAHEELKRWSELNDKKYSSLLSRDEDHVQRVDAVALMLYSLVQQRDARFQSAIAKAAQKDSEEMKFIAVLGSIFLPASLVASIFDIPSLQFASGGTLFAAYMAISLFLIAIVVLLCFSGPRPLQWLFKRFSK